MIHVGHNFAAVKKKSLIMADNRLSTVDNDRTRQKEEAMKANPESVLEAFEHIVELAEDSSLSEEFFQQAGMQIEYAAARMNLSPIQTVLLAIFVDRSEDNCIHLSEIARFLGCRTTKILRLSKEVDALEEMHYVVASRSRGNLSYRVPFEVLESVKADSPYVHVRQPIDSLQAFFDYFSEILGLMEDSELTHGRLLEETLRALDEIKETVYARSLRKLHVEQEEALLFTFMAYRFVEHDDDYIMDHNIDDIYDDGKIPTWCKQGLRNRSLRMFSTDLIENAGRDGILQPNAFKLTDYAKRELLGELNIMVGGKSQEDLLKHDSFAEKKLIYNAQERAQIDELSSILAADRFRSVQERLEKAGMRKGFCCLFYGAPGTGKTETVYQIARRTGRDILRVDVDKVKSCWVGESEKNIKALFDRYRNICRDSELAPILLFNEADAVLGVRMEGAARAVDKMENSIQNIILQEMESLEGIMIATTNLTTNLDKAFERRFLYKVRYERPTPEARAQIWRAMLPELGEEDASQLAAECDLSGGEIENIVRKHSVAAILSGSDLADLKALRELCATERIASPRTRIGF